MGIHIDATQIRELAGDFDRIPVSATSAVSRAVEKTAKDGNKTAQAFARSSAGDHGKWYPDAFEAESNGAALGLSWIYGPNTARRQGGMSFEYGSRNQPPHLDLAKSADIVGPLLAQLVGDAVDGAFW